MAIYTNYDHFRKNIAAFLDEVENSHETLIVQRPGYEDVVIMTAEDYRGLEETVYLLHSPRNAERILSALANAKAGKHSPMTIEDTHHEWSVAELMATKELNGNTHFQFINHIGVYCPNQFLFSHYQDI